MPYASGICIRHVHMLYVCCCWERPSGRHGGGGMRQHLYQKPPKKVSRYQNRGLECSGAALGYILASRHLPDASKISLKPTLELRRLGLRREFFAILPIFRFARCRIWLWAGWPDPPDSGHKFLFLFADLFPICFVICSYIFVQTTICSMPACNACQLTTDI